MQRLGLRRSCSATWSYSMISDSQLPLQWWYFQDHTFRTGVKPEAVPKVALMDALSFPRKFEIQVNLFVFPACLPLFGIARSGFSCVFPRSLSGRFICLVVLCNAYSVVSSA